MTQSYKSDKFFSHNLPHHENNQRSRIKLVLKLSLKREEPMTSDEKQIFKKLGDKRYDFLKLIGYKQVFPPIKLQLTQIIK